MKFEVKKLEDSFQKGKGKQTKHLVNCWTGTVFFFWNFCVLTLPNVRPPMATWHQIYGSPLAIANRHSRQFVDDWVPWVHATFLKPLMSGVVRLVEPVSEGRGPNQTQKWKLEMIFHKLCWTILGWACIFYYDFRHEFRLVVVWDVGMNFWTSQAVWALSRTWDDCRWCSKNGAADGFPSFAEFGGLKHATKNIGTILMSIEKFKHSFCQLRSVKMNFVFSNQCSMLGYEAVASQSPCCAHWYAKLLAMSALLRIGVPRHGVWPTALCSAWGTCHYGRAWTRGQVWFEDFSQLRDDF